MGNQPKSIAVSLRVINYVINATRSRTTASRQRRTSRRRSVRRSERSAECARGKTRVFAGNESRPPTEREKQLGNIWGPPGSPALFKNILFKFFVGPKAPLFGQNVWEEDPGIVFWWLHRKERNSLKMLPTFPLKSVGWSSNSDCLKSENDQHNSWLNARSSLQRL